MYKPSEDNEMRWQLANGWESANPELNPSHPTIQLLGSQAQAAEGAERLVARQALNSWASDCGVAPPPPRRSGLCPLPALDEK